MKSALAIVAFRHATQQQGITALLETALSALDASGNQIVAAHVCMALALLDRQNPCLWSDTIPPISDFG